nr:hypothetical protein [uncultured Anaeromusa sp.]
MRRWSILLTAMLTLLLSSGLVLAQEMNVIDKLNAMDKTLYGSEQTGALMERVQKVEKDVIGQTSKEAIIPRVDTLYESVFHSTEAAPSLLLKVNAVEWALQHQVNGTIPVKSRIEGLERMIMGNSSPGTFQDRVAKLLSLAYADGKAQTVPLTLPKDSLIKISFLTALDSKTARVGDVVEFQAADDVLVNGILAVAKGARGIGKVSKVDRASNFGRDGKIEINFDDIETIDELKVPVFLGEKAKEETKSYAKAAGATVAGMIILGPVGVIGGAFVHGDELKIPVGAQMFVQTKAETSLVGVVPPGTVTQ